MLFNSDEIVIFEPHHRDMAVYKFRIIFEDHEDVVREIEVQGKQSFEEFHRSIQEAIGFDNSKDASFFMSDDYWRKGQEITNAKLAPNDDDDDDYRKPTKTPPKAMSKSRVADFIDDPHQKIVYIFDPAVKWTLLIELVRIQSDDPKSNYPRTTKSSGTAPKQYKQAIAPPVEDEDEEDEEDKKAREKARLFKMEEDYDADAAVGAEEDKSDDAPLAPDEEEVDEVDVDGGEDVEEGGEFGAQEAEEY
jgi:hypothetical protein